MHVHASERDAVEENGVLTHIEMVAWVVPMSSGRLAHGILLTGPPMAPPGIVNSTLWFGARG